MAREVSVLREILLVEPTVRKVIGNLSEKALHQSNTMDIVPTMS